MLEGQGCWGDTLAEPHCLSQGPSALPPPSILHTEARVVFLLTNLSMLPAEYTFIAPRIKIYPRVHHPLLSHSLTVLSCPACASRALLLPSHGLSGGPSFMRSPRAGSPTLPGWLLLTFRPQLESVFLWEAFLISLCI